MQRRPGLRQGAVGHLDLRDRHVLVGLRGVEVRLRDELAVEEAARAIVLPLGVTRLRVRLGQRRIGGQAIRARLIDGRLEQLGIDLRDQLPGLHG